MIRIVILVLSLVLSLKSQAQSNRFLNQPHIEINTKADTLISPDKIYLTITLSEKEKKKSSLEELEKSMIKKLSEIGIDVQKQLSVSDLASDYFQAFLRKQDIKQLKVYELIVFEANTAGIVLSELKAIGISNIGLLKTEVTNINEIKGSLKSTAIKAAKIQAKSMAESVDQSIGKAIMITDLSSNNTHHMLRGKTAGIRIRGAAIDGEAFESEANIEFEKIKLESAVKVIFQLN